MKLTNILNAIIFYTYWWLSFWGASKDIYYIGPLIATFYFIVHFVLIKDKLKEFKYMLFCICVGFIFESILLYSGFISYNGLINQKYSVVPIWVFLLWGGYALTVFHSFKYVIGRYLVSFIIGAFLGPLIYIAGDRVGAVYLNYEITFSYIVLMVMWSIVFPIMNYVSVRIND